MAETDPIKSQRLWTGMARNECLRILAAHRTNEIVVPVYQAAFRWLALSPSDLNYTFVAAMGQAASHGLGLALAFPERRVIVLDGDGSLLMNLGCLVTIANVKPRNLVHLVCNNAMYETTGGQPTPGCDRISLAGFARAAGYPVVHEFDELAEFEQGVPALLSAQGPVFADLRVVPGAESPQDLAKRFGGEQLYTGERRKAFREAVLSL